MLSLGFRLASTKQFVYVFLGHQGFFVDLIVGKTSIPADGFVHFIRVILPGSVGVDDFQYA